MRTRRPLYCLAFTILAFVTGCKKAEQLPAAADSSKMMMSDTTQVSTFDSSKMIGVGAPDSIQSPVDNAMRQLSPGQVRYEGPDTMEVGTPANVLVRLAKATLFSPAPGMPHRQVVTAATKIGDSARVCLESDSSDFRVTPSPCTTQVVASDTSNVWSWLVKPLQPGNRLLNVQVWALLAKMPGKAVFDTTYRIVVTVAPRSLAEKVKDWLLTWQGILAALGGVLTALVAISEKVRGLLFGWIKPPDKPPPATTE